MTAGRELMMTTDTNRVAHPAPRPPPSRSLALTAPVTGAAGARPARAGPPRPALRDIATSARPATTAWPRRAAPTCRSASRGARR
ncbi:MAG: hypothetical protein MZV64_43265 [Ignavibacteriales bacterium]|nr:hypothetical protein [Ignavibacteriales bacterium]